MTTARMNKLKALLRQRCPQCHEGRVFRGPTTMNPCCPVCGLSFEREEGYFLGAMYISYALSVSFLGLGTLAGAVLLPGWNLSLVCLLATIVYLPLVPMVFRYSRVIWIHFDRWAWPGHP